MLHRSRTGVSGRVSRHLKTLTRLNGKQLGSALRQLGVFLAYKMSGCWVFWHLVPSGIPQLSVIFLMDRLAIELQHLFTKSFGDYGNAGTIRSLLSKVEVPKTLSQWCSDLSNGNESPKTTAPSWDHAALRSQGVCAGGEAVTVSELAAASAVWESSRRGQGRKRAMRTLVLVVSMVWME